MAVFVNLTFQPFSAYHFLSKRCKVSENLETRTRSYFPRELLDAQVVWNANDRDSGRSGEKRDENRTSGPPNFEFKVHTSAWVYTYHHDYLGNGSVRKPVVLFNESM